MLNKKVLLGALVAGAMVLPLSASAGVVSGVCVDCHTMHSMQDRIDQGGGATLLKAGGCEGCHIGGTNNSVTGVDATLFSAPQVDDNVNVNLAGFFSLGAADVSKTHNITADITGMAPESVIAGGLAPGGNAANLECIGCHLQASGGHHGQGGTSYRMLFSIAGTDQSEDSGYGNTGTQIVDVSQTVYDSDAMNLVCAGCHGGFHGSGPEQLLGTSWIKHPTDIRLVDAIRDGVNYDYQVNYDTYVATPGLQGIVPLGTSSTINSNVAGAIPGTNTLMCITCHFSHGSANNDMLRFGYNAAGQNEAGDNTMSQGCEMCHSYELEAIAQPGM